MSNTYIVKSKDTLGSIAKANGTTATELAKINAINDPNKVQPGQVLRMPTAAADAASTTSHEDSFWSSTTLRFTDAVGRAIANLKVRLSGDGADLEAVTDANGCLPVKHCKTPNTPLSIHVPPIKVAMKK